MKQPYEVRVREKVGPYKWTLKSKFYFAKNAGEARSKYHGDGKVLEVKKVTRERAQGIGSFFSLGDRLLKEFAEERALEKGGEKKVSANVPVNTGMYEMEPTTGNLIPVTNSTEIKEAKYGRRFNEQRNKATH